MFGASFDTAFIIARLTLPGLCRAERSFNRSTVSTSSENKPRHTAGKNKIRNDRCTRLLATTADSRNYRKGIRCEGDFVQWRETGFDGAWNIVDFGQQGLLEPCQRIRVHFSIHKREIYIWVRHIAWIRGTALFSEPVLFEFEAWSKSLRGRWLFETESFRNEYIYIYKINS